MATGFVTSDSLYHITPQSGNQGKLPSSSPTESPGPNYERALAASISQRGKSEAPTVAGIASTNRNESDDNEETDNSSDEEFIPSICRGTSEDLKKSPPIHQPVCESAAEILQVTVGNEEVPLEQQKWNSSLEKEVPEPPHIKQEQDGEQLQVTMLNGLMEHRLTVEAAFAPNVHSCITDAQQKVIVKEEVHFEQHEWDPGVEGNGPEPLHIKEEQEQWISQEGEQLQGEGSSCSLSIPGSTSSTNQKELHKASWVHLSVLPSGHKPQSTRCKEGGCQFLHCPFCPLYKGDYAKVETHLQSHLQTVVQHGEFVMFSCRWDCRKDSHYHCCACSKIFQRKQQLLTHLGTCHPQPPEDQTHPQPAEDQAGIIEFSSTTIHVKSEHQMNLSPECHQKQTEEGKVDSGSKPVGSLDSDTHLLTDPENRSKLCNEDHTGH